MKRCWILALAGLTLLPVAAPAQSAQFGSAVPPTRVSITPFAGLRVPTIARGGVTITAEDEIIFFEVREERSGGPATGLQAEVHAHRFISVIGAVAYSWPGDVNVAFITDEGIGGGLADGPDVWFAKAGLSFRLPEPQPDRRRYRSVAFVTVAPALIRESADWWQLVEGERTGAVNHFALSVGGEALSALRHNVALHVGLEDFITFWNTGPRRQRQERFFGDPTAPVGVKFNYDPSHIFMARIGLSVRLGGEAPRGIGSR